jgi:signal transduction histidine kinase
MNTAPQPLRLLSLEIRYEQDVVLARQRARELAGQLGFDNQTQTTVATAVSEIARNAFRYAGGGRATFSVLTEPHPADARRTRQTFLIEVRDSGPGIARLDDVLAGHYRSETGLGLGLVGTRRLMDRVDIESTPQGTTVTLARILPPSRLPRTHRELQAIVDELARHQPVSAMEELQIQNRELLEAMDAARKREEELGRVNQELADTNTGVMALYDELETLNRISVMLASKLELKPLIQSIIEVTTALTDADVGAFFFREDSPRWRLYALSGGRAAVLHDYPEDAADALFNETFVPGGMEMLSDVEAEHEPGLCDRFAAQVRGRLAVRSGLAVAVSDAQERVIGAFLFAATRPNVFTERSERILSSVATQAAVGIEKARLFQNVTAASDAKDQFFATLSHELRTPLNPALAIISSLHGDARIPAELREDIAIVARNIRLEARLIDDLLDFNRLIKGKLQLTTGVVDVHALIESVIEICREDLEAKGHQLEAALAAPRSAVIGEAARLQQVLWNVIKNAIKFTPDGGHIAIRTHMGDNVISVSVQDNGRGIEPAALDQIFRAFNQGQSTLAAHFGGLGLGLSIARMFVELHHGRIHASSAGPGQGATITITLPLTDAQPAPASVQPAASSGPAGRQARLLLVDDHMDTLRGLARLLERRGFHVTPAPSGGDALAAVEKERFDLLISDLGLPDCSGLELVSRISTLQPMPAIALSGYGMEADLGRSREAGFHLHITKPVDFEELLHAIESLLGVK